MDREHVKNLTIRAMAQQVRDHETAEEIEGLKALIKRAFREGRQSGMDEERNGVPGNTIAHDDWEEFKTTYEI